MPCGTSGDHRAECQRRSFWRLHETLHPLRTAGDPRDDRLRCSRCLQHLPAAGVQGETRSTGRSNKAELDALIEEYRGKYDYDCIVPFSGGKDSTLTLYYLVKEYGLKPLVVRFDHGFLRPNLRRERSGRIAHASASTS